MATQGGISRWLRSVWCTRRLAVLSVLSFIVGAACYVAIWITQPHREFGYYITPHGEFWYYFARWIMYLSQPVGLALAFASVVKKEMPARLAIVGFCLNVAWYSASPIKAVYAAIHGPRQRAILKPAHNPALTVAFTEYMMDEYPRRAGRFKHLARIANMHAQITKLRTEDLIRLLGEPDRAKTWEVVYVCTPTGGVVEDSLKFQIEDDRVVSLSFHTLREGHDLSQPQDADGS